MQAPITALLDANVLYPAPLRDFLLCLAQDELFLPKWSDEIHDEWTRNLQKNRPDLNLNQIQRTREKMNAAFPEAMTSGYEHWIPLLTNHPKDRHVLATAIQCSARYIVTFNLKDFPTSSLLMHKIKAISPDVFTLALYERHATDMISTIQWHRAQLKKPPKTAEQYLDTLVATGLIKTAAALQKHLGEL
jgi:predicted nucleic acid-binding protein